MGQLPSISSKNSVCRQRSIVGAAAVDRCDGRPSKVEAVDRRGFHFQESLCLQLSTAIRAGGRLTEAIGRPLSGQRSTACRLLQVILQKILQMSQMTQENKKVTEQSEKYKCVSSKHPHGSGAYPSHREGLEVSSPNPPGWEELDPIE